MEDTEKKENRIIVSSTKSYIKEGLTKIDGNVLMNVGLTDCDVFIADPADINREILRNMPGCRLIISCRMGVDACDFEYIHSHNIKLVAAKGLYSNAIAEHIAACILQDSTNLTIYAKQKQSREYRPCSSRMLLSDKTVGFFGTGSIAQAAAKVLSGFGCNIIGYKRTHINGLDYFSRLYYSPDLNRFLRQCDYLVLCADLNSETANLVNTAFLNEMKDTSCLINVSRGGLIDEEDLVRQLNTERIRYAYLDVFKNEPLKSDSILWQCENLFITPHVSGICSRNHDAMIQYCAQCMKQFFERNTIAEKGPGLSD